MRGVLLDHSVTYIKPIYDDGLDVTVTSNITWFHANHGMVSRRIHRLFIYGGHSITLGHPE